MTIHDILLPGNDTAVLFPTYICLHKIIITMTSNTNQNQFIMKPLIIIILTFLACTFSNVTMANHTSQIFSIDNLLTRKDFMSSQSSIFFPENYELTAPKCNFSAKLDTITDILYFSKYRSMISNIQNLSEKNTLIQGSINKDFLVMLWNGSIITEEKKIFSENEYCTKA